MQYHYQDFKEYITIGSRLKCNRRTVEAQSYYQKKLDEVETEWNRLKELS